MKINQLNLNDWKINQLLLFVIIIQISLVALVFLDYIGIMVPILRQIVAFIYLLFIPGFLIFRILGIENSKSIESILYVIGLSVASTMFIGFGLNFISALLNIGHPINLNLLLLSFGVYVLILSILAYHMNDEKTMKVEENNWELNNFNNLIIFFILLPFLTVIGTYLVNVYLNSTFLMSIILIIAIIPVLISYDRIPSKYYPLVIFSLSISLLFHTSLISNYVWGWDIYSEYHYANLVLNNQLWQPNLDYSSNSVLSVVIFAPIFSIISDLNLTWVFKIVYPFLFSLVPVGLYILFKKNVNNSKIAFLSCFLFIAIFTFYGEMLSLARQEIAEFFLIIMLIVFFSKYVDKKPILYVIFGLSLVVSHYSLSYLYMFILFGVWFTIFVMDKLPIPSLMAKIGLTAKKGLKSYENNKLTLNFVFLFAVFTIAWYAFGSSQMSFEALVKTISNVISNMYSDFLNPTTTQGLEIITTSTSPMRNIAKYFHLITQFLIIIGFTFVTFKNRLNFETKYLIFSFFNLIMLFGAIFLPYFAGSLNTSRLYQISLIFLAPFCIIGAIVIWRFFFKLIGGVRAFNMDVPIKIMSIFLAVFLLFNTGFIIEFTTESPSSLAFSPDYFSPMLGSVSDESSSNWIKEYKNSNYAIYGDYYSRLSLIAYGNFELSSIKKLNSWSTIQPHSYLYLRSGEVQFLNSSNDYESFKLNSPKFSPRMNKIYDDQSEIYYNDHDSLIKQIS